MNIALVGYGKMGKAIEEIALQKGHKIVAKIDQDNYTELSTLNRESCDVAIEFTNPDAAKKNILSLLKQGVPVVSGSTGWVSDLDEVQTFCHSSNGSFIYASNYSVGVNLFFALNEKLAALMQHQPQYKASLKEVHHTAKKDAPSGTAITLAEQIIAVTSIYKNWKNDASEQQGALNIISEREDPAPGTHHIKYQSEVDEIEIVHTAHSRVGFAAGAVLAAEYIADKTGVFNMKQVLGI
jgi:4-hydroxy-tetrahydrodipicolinate reductase